MSGSDLTRRHFFGGALASCAFGLTAAPAWAYQDPDDPFELPPFDEKKLPKQFRRAVVDYPTRHWPGTVIVNTGNRQLFILLCAGCAADSNGSYYFSFPFKWNPALQRCEILQISAQRDH